MANIVAIGLRPDKNLPIVFVEKVLAIPGKGLEGDRRNKKEGLKRQVTLITEEAVKQSTYTHEQTRRNILTKGIELNDLLGRYFRIGNVILQGESYCTPCAHPAQLLSRDENDFREQFHDRAGITAVIIEGGEIYVGDEIVMIKSTSS